MNMETECDIHVALHINTEGSSDGDVGQQAINQLLELYDKHQVIKLGHSGFMSKRKQNLDTLKQQRMAEVKTDMVLTQSIAVVILPVDTQAQLPDIDICRQTLGNKPWRFHHITELNTLSRNSHKVHARQEYHEVNKDMPLFSMSTIHHGSLIIRINLFTYNHEAMVDFYQQLLHTEPTRVRQDFCFFSFPQEGVTIQLSLKHSDKIMPYPISRAQLVVKVPKIPEHIPQSQKLVTDHCSWVVDPDYNTVVIQERKTPNNTCTVELIKTTLGSENIDLTPVNEDDLYKSDPKKLKDLLDGEKPDIETIEKTEVSLRMPRPDVIPDKDRIEQLDTEPVKQTVTRKFIKLGQRNRPAKAMTGNKLNISVTAYSCDKAKREGNSCENNNTTNGLTKLLQKRDSIDVLASF